MRAFAIGVCVVVETVPKIAPVTNSALSPRWTDSADRTTTQSMHLIFGMELAPKRRVMAHAPRFAG
jgi:hypothetical protein